MKFEIISTLVLSIGILVSWLAGWPTIAIAIFILGAVVKIVLSFSRLHQVSSAIQTNREQLHMSVAFLNKDNSKRMIFTAILVSLGEAACWPIRALVGGICGLTARPLDRIVRPSTFETQKDIFFQFPFALVILLSFTLQSIFMLVGFADESRAGLAFYAAAWIQIIGFIAFMLHFFGRRQFLKNFSASSINPVVFFLIASILSVLCAITIRLLYSAAFVVGPNQLSLDSAFAALRALIENSGIFDLPELIKSSNNISDLFSKLGEFFVSIDALKALDIFLGFSVLSTFGRSAWGVLRFKRDDEDRMVRVNHFLNSRKFEQANKEVAELENNEKKEQMHSVLAIAELDYEKFLHHLDKVSPSSDLYVFGNMPRVVQYVALTNSIMLVPLSLEEFCVIAQKYWEKHENCSATFYLYLGFIQVRGIEFDEALKCQENFSFAKVASDALEIVFNPEHKGVDMAKAILAHFGEERISMVLISTTIVLGAAIAEKSTEKRKEMKTKLDDTFALIEDRLNTDASLEPISFALFPNVLPAPKLYQKAFHTRSSTLGRIIKIYEREMKAQNLVLPDIFDQIKKTEVSLD